MVNHPESRLPDIFVHGGRCRADHPALPVAGTDLGADLLRLLRIPELLPGLGVQIAHDLLGLRPVAGHDIPIGINKEGVKGHIAGKKALLPVDVIDQSVVKIRAEPLLRLV